MKVRHVLAVIAAATAFVAYFDDPAHSATVDYNAVGIIVQASNECRGEVILPPAVVAEASQAYSEATGANADAINAGVNAFDMLAAEAHHQTCAAALKIARKF